MDHYGDRLAFGFHRFPLPYHHNAFYAWQAGGVIEANQPQDVWKWVDQFFGPAFPNQMNFSNAATARASQVEVIHQLATMATAVTGISEHTFLQGMAYDSKIDEATRASWKYGCSRSVSGTPTFLLNGVLAAGQPTWKLSDWTALIDPLMGFGVSECPGCGPDVTPAACAVIHGCCKCCAKPNPCKGDDNVTLGSA